jgi:molybdenum cofactor cytidylyltransferase
MDSNKFFTVILAAGQSKRMQESKIVLPWGGETVISHIISQFQGAGISEIVVVTGGYRDLVEPVVLESGAKPIFNPNFANDEMSISLKTGLNSINIDIFSGGFISLGDQPNVFTEDIQKMCQSSSENPDCIIIPSYNMRRGHPWLIPNKLLYELKKLSPPDTMRDFLKQHENDIKYALVDHPEILSDMDTPQDYHRIKPK